MTAGADRVGSPEVHGWPGYADELYDVLAVGFDSLLIAALAAKEAVG